MSAKRSAAGGARRTGYHHGDLEQALIEAAIQLIDERGVREFSLAEASRRVGVAASAPYAHFADRDELLAAVAVHALRLFEADLRRRTRREATAARRLCSISRSYVQFAGRREPLFRTLFEVRLDKGRHVELAAAEERIDGAFRDAVREVVGSGGEPEVEPLAAAIEATAHGHALLLLDGRFGRGRRAIESAAGGAARATAALIEGRRLLDERTRPER